MLAEFPDWLVRVRSRGTVPKGPEPDPAIETNLSLFLSEGNKFDFSIWYEMENFDFIPETVTPLKVLSKVSGGECNICYLTRIITSSWVLAKVAGNTD